MKNVAGVVDVTLSKSFQVLQVISYYKNAQIDETLKCRRTQYACILFF